MPLGKAGVIEFIKEIAGINYYFNKSIIIN
jgi:hypothetical protein